MALELVFGMLACGFGLRVGCRRCGVAVAWQIVGFVDDFGLVKVSQWAGLGLLKSCSIVLMMDESNADDDVKNPFAVSTTHRLPRPTSHRRTD